MKKLAADKVKVTGDIPSPRFGHTFTMVSSTKAVLFGGAVLLAGRFVITNETYVYDFPSSKWTKLAFRLDFVPAQRAAHAAVAVSDMQLIIYGGAASGNQGLLKDQLYILDLRKDPIWRIIEVSNKNCTPGQRYGHTMVFNKPHIVVFGGNSGNKAENDVWLLNILKGPFTWQKYQFPNKVIPSPRVYHAAAICEEGSALGMMVVFGGRKQTRRDHNGSQRQLTLAALNDIWGLRKHRDGSWDWVTPPKSQSYNPICRYQHIVSFMGSNLLIMGGRSNNAEQAVSLVQVYDTQRSQWSKFSSVSRYRHAAVVFNKTQLFIHGGFQPELASQPLQSMITMDLNLTLQSTKPMNNNWIQRQTASHESQSQRRVLAQNDNIQNMGQQQNNMQFIKTGQIRREGLGGIQNQKNMARSSRIRSVLSNMNKTTNKERDLTPSRIINSIKNIKMSKQAVVATGENPNIMQIQKVPLNSLLQESKKLIITQQQMQFHDISNLQFAQGILQTLFASAQQKPPLTSTLFPFKKDKVVRLCQQASKLVINESSLVGVRPPVKIFGSIYGRFYDLLRLFDSFGFPDEHEMQSNQYVFLGNYVDKGFNSLQTVCLLMALKIRYPEHITLLRGKHEDSTINRICGLGQECSLRMGQNINDVNSVFNYINNFFDCLPLAAAIQDKFLCIHSGIGSIQSLIEIKEVSRPIKVRNSQVVMDLLWSGTRDQKKLNYQSKNCSDEQIEHFLEQNLLEMIINTRDGLPHGVDEERHTLSVFSVTNYANSNNKAGILKINKTLSLVPYLLNSSPTKKGHWVSQISTKNPLNFTTVQNQIRNAMFQV